MAYGSATGFPSSVSDVNSIIGAYNGNALNLNAGTVASLGNKLDNYKEIPLICFFGGLGTVIPTNQFFNLTCPSNGTITRYRMACSDSSGTATVKIWKRATGTSLPTIANVISNNGFTLTTGTGGANTLINSTNVSDLTTTTVAAQDEFVFIVTSASVLTYLSFALYISRT